MLNLIFVLIQAFCKYFRFFQLRKWEIKYHRFAWEAFNIEVEIYSIRHLFSNDLQVKRNERNYNKSGSIKC